MSSKELLVGTRDSNLAIKQAEEIIGLIKKRYPDVRFYIKRYKTSGDYDKKTPLCEISTSNFFTDALDQALLMDEIDIAVHSAKDLPDIIPSRLVVSAITKTIDPYDVLVSKGNLKLDQLPYGAKIATSSKSRKEQLKRIRPDLNVVDIRGNVEDRLLMLDNSDIDALVIAAAGLMRLGLEEKITQRLPFDIITPHPLQGSLAVEVKKTNVGVVTLTNFIDTRKKILFVCIENSCRSQIAEALVNHFYWQRCFAVSAGSNPSGVVNPLAIEVMKEKGVDITCHKSKGFKEIYGINFDYVITMGCGDACPLYPASRRIDWLIPDPKGKQIDFFRKIRDEIESKIKDFINNLHS